MKKHFLSTYHSSCVVPCYWWVLCSVFIPVPTSPPPHLFVMNTCYMNFEIRYSFSLGLTFWGMFITRCYCELWSFLKKLWGGGGGFTRSVGLGLCVELVLFLFVKWNGRPSSYRSKNLFIFKSMAKENQESFTQWPWCLFQVPAPFKKLSNVSSMLWCPTDDSMMCNLPRRPFHVS